MARSTSHRTLTRAVIEAAPELRYVGFYHADEKRLLACMQDYSDRSFIYILTIKFNDKEFPLYVGQSRFQYARIMSHTKHFSFDFLYLFECEREQLNSCERRVIRAMAPLYNCTQNPQAARYKLLLNLDYKKAHSTEETHHHLKVLTRYSTSGLYGIELPMPLFEALRKIAAKEGSTVSKVIQSTLEERFPEEIISCANNTTASFPKCNLLTTHDYCKAVDRKSTEWIKKVLQEGRITGFKTGRDWIISEDARLPPDKRKGDWSVLEV